MPAVSKAQNAAMHAAASGHSTLGIPKKVGQEFVAATHGKNVSKLPEHKSKKKPKHKFGEPHYYKREMKKVSDETPEPSS